MNNKKKTFLFIIFILLIAIVPRLYCLRSKGLFSYDEGHYLLEAKFFYSLITNAPLITKHLLSESYDFAYVQSIIQGVPPCSRKPLHNLFIALMFFITGVKDYAPFFVSLIFSLFSIGGIYLLGKTFYDKRTGAIAALVLSASAYFLMYSRAARGIADSIFFFLLGTYFYYLSSILSERRFKRLILSGLFFGLSVACDYKWMFMLPLFLLFELRVWITHHGLSVKEKFKRLSCFILPIIAILFLIDLPFRVFLMLKSVPFPVSTYLGSFLGIGKQHLVTFFTALQPQLLFFRYLWELEGPIVFILLFCGIVYALINISKKRSLGDIMIITLFLMPFIGFSLTERGDHPRAIAITLPFIALIVARLVASPPKILRNREKIASVMGVIIVLYGLYNCREMITFKSGYREACAFLKQHGGEKHFTTQWPISAFYAGRDNAYYPFPGSVNELRRIHQEEGIDFLLVDWQKYCWDQKKVTDKIEALCKPVYVVPNNIGTSFTLATENFHYRRGETEDMMRDKSIREIRIYDLRKCFSKELVK